MSTDVHLYRRDEEVAWTLGCMACPVISWELLKTEHSFHCLFLNPAIVLFFTTPYWLFFKIPLEGKVQKGF